MLKSLIGRAVTYFSSGVIVALVGLNGLFLYGDYKSGYMKKTLNEMKGGTDHGKSDCEDTDRVNC